MPETRLPPTLWVICQTIHDDEGGETLQINAVVTTRERALIHIVNPDIVAVEMAPDTDYSETDTFTVIGFDSPEPYQATGYGLPPLLH